ncbi:MAG: leucine--tRNA ligase, partial [Hyphomonadaceae bacterium]
EAWETLGFTPFVSTAAWPEAEAALLEDARIVMPVQVNGKRRGEIEIPKGLGEDAVRDIALAHERVAPFLAGLTVRKVVVVPDRIVNIVAT